MYNSPVSYLVTRLAPYVKGKIFVLSECGGIIVSKGSV